MTQALMRRHERRAAIDVTVRANLNEALAALLIASHTQKLTCVAVSQAWDHAVEQLDNPFQDEVRRWVDEHDRYYAAP